MMRKSGDCAFSAFLPASVVADVFVFADAPDVEAVRAGGIAMLVVFALEPPEDGGGLVDCTDISACASGAAEATESCAMTLGVAAGDIEAPQPVPARTIASAIKRRCVLTPSKRADAEDLTVALG